MRYSNMSWPCVRALSLVLLIASQGIPSPQNCSFMKLYPEYAQQIGTVKHIKGPLRFMELSAWLPSFQNTAPQIGTILDSPNSNLIFSVQSGHMVLSGFLLTALRSKIWKLPPGRKLGHNWAYLVHFLSVRDHSSALPVVQYLKTDVPCILSSFLVVYSRG